MDSLTSSTGIVALVAAGLALVALVAALVASLRARRLAQAQSAVLGTSGKEDLVAHADRLARRVDELEARLREATDRLDRRAIEAERRLDTTISRASVVRFDAYDEMTGRQSSAIALLDDGGSGLVLSAITQRDQARFYAKGIEEGRSELALSPEEEEAIRIAMSRGGAQKQ